MKCFLFLTHIICDELLQLCNKIKNELHNDVVFYILLDNTSNKYDLYVNDNFNIYKFSYIDIYEKYNVLNDFFLPYYVGNSIFPIIDFYLKNQYDYYIINEYDCYYSGNYGNLIENIFIDEFDYLIQESPQSITETVDLWDKYTKDKNNILINFVRYKSLFQFYCLKNNVLDYIYNIYNNGVSGHYEIILPTLLINSKFKYKLLTDYCHTNMTYKNVVYDNLNENTMYHPIKY